jgi:Holliday junction resolvasome RuvABC endonuclease subunit
MDARQSTYPDFSVDTTNVSEVDKILNIILSDVMSVVDRFGPERVIIENSPYQAEEGNTMRLCVQLLDSSA